MCVYAKSFQPCPGCDPMDCSPPGSSVYGILREEHWGGLPCPPPGDLPNSGIEAASPVSPALAGGFFMAEPPRNPSACIQTYIFTKIRPDSSFGLGNLIF